MKKVAKRNFNVLDRALWIAPTVQSLTRRPGAMDMLQKPSRMGNSLYYPDGRVVKDTK